MNKRAGIFLIAVLLSACQANQLVRVPLAGVSDGPPEISSVIDLGSLSVPGNGSLDVSESDGMFVAGEWVALVGKGLNTKQARLFLDNAELPVAGGVEGGGLLFRLPRDLKFRHTYALRVQTDRGSAERLLRVTNFVAMSDPKEGRILFWRTTNPTEQKELFEKEFSAVSCPGAGLVSLAPNGGILYSTARGALKTFHVGARGSQREVSSVEFKAKHEPVALVLSSGGSHAFLLTRAELIVFDLSDPRQPRFTAKHDLAPPSSGTAPAFRNLVLVGGNKAALLEEERNLVRLIDLSLPSAPVVIGDFAIGAPAGKSYSVALAADPGDPNALLVLTGVNGQQLRQRLSSLWSDKPGDATPTRGALVRMELKENALIAGAPLNLPEGVLPLGLYADKNGDMLISALAYEKETLAKTELSWEGAANLAKGVRDSIFAGRIYRVTPAGTVGIEMRSVNIPLSVSRLEDSPLLYSTYRLSIRYILPSAKVVLAVDALKQQSLKVREMDWKTILPPYKFIHEITVF